MACGSSACPCRLPNEDLDFADSVPVKAERQEIKGNTVYISGPMSGWDHNNALAFKVRATKLRDKGFSVISPPELDQMEGKPISYQAAMRRDFKALTDCDYISVLDGAGSSVGATSEIAVAAKLMGIQELDENGNVVLSRSILQQAELLVGGDRQKAYGHPSVDFERTAALWSAALGIKIAKEMVPIFMMLVKISREINRHKEDNLIDLAGYAATAQMLHDTPTGT